MKVDFQPTPNLDLGRQAALSGRAKADYVGGMFGRIAHRYDLMNALMSFGQDSMWRRYTAKQARPRPGALALDVATGTGRIARELAHKGARVLAVDFSPEMMLQGKREGIGLSEPVFFVGGDALSLPFPDATFDCVTTGFAMRNVTDIPAAFREMCRVVKPGGRVVCLEVGRPRWPVARALHAIYTGKVVPLLGRLVVGDADAYTYLPNSMRKFPPPRELAGIMRNSGLRDVRFKQLTFGAVAVHVGIRD
ncbi:MAG: class I SAM-dependent methyltransferase [Chloroflexia bacterium]